MKFTLPHWAGLVLSLAAVVITWAVAANSSGNLALPATAVTLLILASKIIGLLSVSIDPMANARAALKTGEVVPTSLAEKAMRASGPGGTISPPPPEEITANDFVSGRKSP